MGSAFGYNAENISPYQVRREIMDQQKELIQAGLTTLENGAFARPGFTVT